MNSADAAVAICWTSGFSSSLPSPPTTSITEWAAALKSWRSFASFSAGRALCTAACAPSRTASDRQAASRTIDVIVRTAVLARSASAASGTTCADDPGTEKLDAVHERADRVRDVARRLADLLCADQRRDRHVRRHEVAEGLLEVLDRVPLHIHRGEDRARDLDRLDLGLSRSSFEYRGVGTRKVVGISSPPSIARSSDVVNDRVPFMLAESDTAQSRVQTASLVTLTTTPSGAPKQNNPSQCWRIPAMDSLTRSRSKAMCVTMPMRGLTCLIM